jgi:signal transduction histidine kinase
MKKEVSCINSRAILDYLKKERGLNCDGLLCDLDPELDALPDPEGFLRDPNNWISGEVTVKLYERARRLLEDEYAAFRIARYAVERNSMGYAQRIIFKAFWSSIKALKHAQKINDKWNRNKRVEIVKLEGNRAIVRLHWNSQMAASKDMCLMNQGAYAYIPVVWGGRPNFLEEVCCYFEGAPYCEYHLKGPLRNKFYAFFSRLFTSKSVLMETIQEMEADKRVIEEKFDEVNRLNMALNYKVKQLMAIQDTGKAVVSVLDLGELLSVIMNILSNVCRINRALIMLVNQREGCLEFLHGAGYEGELPEAVKNYRVPLNRVSNILGRVTNTGQPEYVADVACSSLRKENIMLAHARPTSLFVVPLITRSKVIGVIATDAVDGEGIPRETRETLEIFAPQIAIALENARLYSRLQKQMLDLKRSHALLSRAEKFSFLGNLAARLAHEIKNPLTAIGTFIQMLPRKFDDAEFRQGFYRIAMEETNRVNNLVTELLDLVKTREPHFEFNDLHDLIERMILLVSPQSNAKRIQVERHFDERIGLVQLDGEKMKQVVLNLLSNAVEFTPENGRIEVGTVVRGDRGGEHFIEIEIRDNGPGIPEAIAEKIFDPYFTTKHRSRMHSGTGLGLFIAHQNMQDHRGTIEVSSRPGGGAVFTLRLPVDQPAEEPDLCLGESAHAHH